jgi:DNA-binding transcriptional MerR regulator
LLYMKDFLLQLEEQLLYLKGDSLPSMFALETPMLYSVQELSDATGLSIESIRHYVKRGLIPKATPKGPNTTYEDDHYLRLMALKGMREQGLNLTAIKARLASASEAELLPIAGLVLRNDPGAGAPPPAPQAKLPARLLVDAVLCAAAEAFPSTPAAMRGPLIAAFTRARELGLGLDEVASALAAAAGGPHSR